MDLRLTESIQGVHYGSIRKKPEKQGAHETPSLLQLDDGIQSLCLLGSFKGASGMQLFLESHYPYQRISLDDSTLSELSPDLMLVGARCGRAG
ncbi:MAG: hypothetical protein IPM37_22975 [Hahellaceae bacterium]|nr:hypothetical protein [Hahellaceae bacterium]